MGVDPRIKVNADRIFRIIDRARWAPSGDNTQPWRFEIVCENHLIVHGHDTRHTVVYDLRGHASQIAVGALLESLSIAATGEGLRTDITLLPSVNGSDEHPRFDVTFQEDSLSKPDPLLPYLEIRSVNRRPFGTDPILKEEKKILHNLMGTKNSEFEILWLEKPLQKLNMAILTQWSGKLRLTIPEAYKVHKEVIEWNARFSQDRIPDQALGISFSILPLLRWIMGSWDRVQFFNRFLGGTVIPRIQLDILPAIFCSAHFALLGPTPPRALMDYIKAGRVLCRFWLGVTSLGLQFQPEMTPLIFYSYVKESIGFSSRPGSINDARKIASKLDGIIGEDAASRTVFLGRIGRGQPALSRSLRLPVNLLLHQ